MGKRQTANIQTSKQQLENKIYKIDGYNMIYGVNAG